MMQYQIVFKFESLYESKFNLKSIKSSMIYLFQMKFVVTLFVLAVLGCHNALAEEESAARLLASKNILNQYLVEDKDLTVDYKIFNIGGR